MRNRPNPATSTENHDMIEKIMTQECRRTQPGNRAGARDVSGTGEGSLRSG
jgi:hypothetical protein